MQTLVIATRNRHKTQEFADILANHFAVQDLNSVSGSPEVEETGETFEANAILKAIPASQHTEGLALADDSGLEVDGLDGAPGVRSARYAGEPSNDDNNNALLLQNLSSIRGKNRAARFRCVLALADRGSLVATFSGSVEGIIAPAPRGTAGFGYDPLFIPNGHCQSFAEIGAELKNQMSHRASALQKFLVWLQSEKCNPA